MKTITCNNCGWVYFAVTRERAQADVDGFNKFYDEASEETREHFGGRSSLLSYSICARCGNGHQNFRESRPGDCPDLVTMSPMIWEPERPPALR